MCFSAEASFIASGILLPLGLYSATNAFIKDKRYLLFSFIPFVFSIHQFIEGLLWKQFHEQSYSSMYYSALAFLFIAFFVWPIYIPLSVYTIESNRSRKKIVGILIYCGLLLSIASYLPLLIGLWHVHVAVVKNAISYPVYQPSYIKIIFTLLYVSIILIPLFICSIKKVRVFGWLLLVSFIFTSVWFYYALTSVWCFFAALLSLYIIYFIHHINSNRQ